jgi:hypothetical protein
MSLSVYVIYHDLLNWENYKQLEPDELDLITFVCVNKDIEKKTDFTPEKVIFEWDLPIYDSNLQRKHVCDETMIPKSHFNETGVHWHLAVNKVCKTEYIYVCHNDMIFTKGSLRNVKSLLAPTKGITIARADFHNIVKTSTYSDHEIDMYWYAIKEMGVDPSKQFPLFTNCAMKTNLFEQQMEKLIVVNKKLFMATLPGHWYRPATTFERTWGLAMGDVLDEVIVVNGILHSHPPIDEVLRQTENGRVSQYPEFNQ